MLNSIFNVKYLRNAEKLLGVITRLINRGIMIMMRMRAQKVALNSLIIVYLNVMAILKKVPACTRHKTIE